MSKHRGSALRSIFLVSKILLVEFALLLIALVRVLASQILVIGQARSIPIPGLGLAEQLFVLDIRHQLVHLPGLVVVVVFFALLMDLGV
jgi:hypothetical protein